jgi:hypothetical protein
MLFRRFTFLVLIGGMSLSVSGQLKTKDLVGKWLYLRGSGGITGKGPGFKPEDKVIYRFSKNAEVRHYQKGKPKGKQNFTLSKAGDPIDPMYTTQIKYSNGHTQLAGIKADTLYLKDSMADGFELVLLRN